MEKLGSLVGSHDVAVSFVPAFMHGAVAEKCIEHRKPLVNASYIQPELKALNE
jgi:saccharopine dehydrogenase-like NADP-dependent oxidoreductase